MGFRCYRLQWMVGRQRIVDEAAREEEEQPVRSAADDRPRRLRNITKKIGTMGPKKRQKATRKNLRAELVSIFARATLPTSKLEVGASWLFEEGAISMMELLDHDAVNGRYAVDGGLFDPFCDAMQLKVLERQRLAREIEILNQIIQDPTLDEKS